MPLRSERALGFAEVLCLRVGLASRSALFRADPVRVEHPPQFRDRRIRNDIVPDDHQGKPPSTIHGREHEFLCRVIVIDVEESVGQTCVHQILAHAVRQTAPCGAVYLNIACHGSLRWQHGNCGASAESRALQMFVVGCVRIDDHACVAAYRSPHAVQRAVQRTTHIRPMA